MFENIKYLHGGKFISRGEVWKHPERVIDSTEIIIVLKGKAYITEGETEYVLSAGDILRLSGGIRHYGSRESRGKVSFYWLHFSGGDDLVPFKYIQSANLGEAELICRQILHYEKSGKHPKIITDYLMRVLLMELSALSEDMAESPKRLTSEICEWIRTNCDLPIKAKDVAEHFGYNEDYLLRLFKSSHPEGIKAYIDGERMKKIKLAIIGGDKTLKEIASDFSFSEYKYFLKYFKYHEGISPTKYKESYCDLHTNNH